MENKLNTVYEIIAHLEDAKKRQDEILKQHPDLKFASYELKDIEPHLMFELKERFEVVNKAYLYLKPTLQFTGYNLVLSNYGSPLWCTIHSVKVKKKEAEYEQYEVITE